MNLNNELATALADLDHAFADLQDTYQTVKAVDLSIHFWSLSSADRGSVDLLAQRYASFQDMLHKRVFRTISMLEGETPQTPRESVDLMEKLGILSADDWMNLVREVRNDLSHEGIAQRRSEIAGEMIETTPLVLEVFGKLKAFCRKRKYL